MKATIVILLLCLSAATRGQTLKTRPRKADALSGSAFAKSISDTALSLKQREKIIFKTIKSGNIPDFYRKLSVIQDSAMINDIKIKITYFAIPDFLAIGTDSDYFYCPMTPAMAQRVAHKLKCSLPTRKMSDQIYRAAVVKMVPQPIPPSAAMTTVPVFIKHNELVKLQRDSLLQQFPLGSLTAGDKKDIIISNRIYNDTSAYHVVIYGWHRPGGKAIQPLYARHLSTWADYSHGVRLIQKQVWVNAKKISIKKVLRSPELCVLLSDEGVIRKPWYP